MCHQMTKVSEMLLKQSKGGAKRKNTPSCMF